MLVADERLSFRLGVSRTLNGQEITSLATHLHLQLRMPDQAGSDEEYAVAGQALKKIRGAGHEQRGGDQRAGSADIRNSVRRRNREIPRVGTAGGENGCRDGKGGGQKATGNRCGQISTRMSEPLVAIARVAQSASAFLSLLLAGSVFLLPEDNVGMVVGPWLRMSGWPVAACSAEAAGS